MLTEIDRAQAAAEDWDVVIAGSSFAAMFFLRGLRPGLRVLVVEKGRAVPHAAQLAGDRLPREDYAQQNSSGAAKEWIATTGFGGNSNCWWGQVPRFHPEDFRLAELYGVGAPWPLGYDELEPYWSEVEAVMEISGGGNEHLLPRSAPFPLPPHAPSRTDRVLRREMPGIWFAAPTARASGGSRATCCANGVCQLCPVDAKFTVLNGLAAFERPEARLLSGAAVRRVLRSAGTVTGVTVGEEETEIRAPLVALGTNAVNNAAILLRSGFASPALGRYLHEQTSHMLLVDVGMPNYFGGTSITGHGYGFYAGPHRAQAAAVLVENFNMPAAYRPVPGRWTHRMQLKLIAEDLPQAGNRVELGPDDAPRLVWTGHSDYARAGIARATAGLAQILPFPVEAVHDRGPAATEAHIQGTHRMGTDPAASVTDDRHRLHEAPDVLALGAGGFPACSPANPTLTLSALALRAGRLL
jgi:choline dehydrogenase-like flavoprotein